MLSIYTEMPGQSREKRTPHYVLSDVLKAWHEQGDINTTLRTAEFLENELGLNGAQDRLRFIAGIQRVDFHKSLCHWDDHRIWQDVYRPTFAAFDGSQRELYVKITVTEFGGPFLLIQTKDK